MDPIRIGLIGLGRHGIRYARHLLQDIPGAKLVAVSRRNEPLGQDYADAHGLRFYPDYRDLLAAPSVDAVVVVTPPAVSYAVCLDAVRAGKPLLIEKPLASTASEARDMVRAAQSAGVALMTAQTLRFEPAVQILKAELPLAGAPQYLVLTSRIEVRPGRKKDLQGFRGRGVLLEVGIHLLDLVRFLTDEEVVEVRCEMDSAEPGRPETRAIASLKTTGGMLCLLDVSRVTAIRIGRGEWVGSKGEILADWARHRVFRFLEGESVEEREVKERATIIDTLEAFASALAQGKPMPITGLDGQRAVEIADACYESAASDRTVKVKKQGLSAEC